MAAKMSRPRGDAVLRIIKDSVEQIAGDEPSDPEAAEVLAYLQGKKLAVTSPDVRERDELRKDHLSLTHLIDNT